MVASLLKVVSSGIQDERLYTKETIFPFEKIWIKAGRFTMKWERLDFENTPTFGNTGFLKLPRKGHLITRLILVATMPDINTPQQLATIANNNNPVYPQFGWTNSLGHALISQLTCDIATTRVETMDGRLLEIMDEFNTPIEKVPIVNELIKRKENGFNSKSFGRSPNPETVCVPLPFWFSRGDPGCALPIDAIPYSDVRIGVTFRTLNGVYFTETQLPKTNQNQGDGSMLYPLSGSNFYAQDPLINPGQPLQNAFGPIQMPLNLQLGDCYMMAEYVYLDQNEANRFRLADLHVPIVQHYAMNPYDSRGLSMARIRLDIPNPTRDIFFMCNPYMASSYNAHLLGTRDMTGTANTQPSDIEYPWWPDAKGASNPLGHMRSGFSLSDSEPLVGYELDYQGTFVRFRTEGPALFRSIVPGYEQRKTPYINRYYYNIPLGICNGYTPFSKPQGEANLDKITNRELILQFRAKSGMATNERCMVYVYGETYNIFRVYGGRAGIMFAY
jgi:hypothetical protein